MVVASLCVLKVGDLADVLVSILHMVWLEEEGLDANSCEPMVGGGKKGEPGEGKGDAEGGWSTAKERR